MQNLDFKNSYVLVEEVLSDKPYEKTEKVYLNQNDGGRVGPFVRKSFDNKNSLGAVYKILQGHNHPNLPAIYYVSDSVIFEEFIEGRSFAKDDIEYFLQVCDAVKFLHTNFNKPVIHRDIKPENIIITQDGVAKLIDFGIAREYVTGQLTDTQYFGTVGFAAPEQFGFAQTDVRSDIFSLGKLLNYVTDDYKDIIKRATSLDPSDRYKTVNDLKRDFEKSYNKSPVIKKLGIVWNILLTLIFLGFVALTIWTIFFAPDKINTKSLPQAIVMAIMLIDFIFFPLYYISLYRFKWMIKLNWKNRISIIVCCGFAVFVLAIISTLL